jgi:RND family efflux transporter MFP subunit
MPSLLNVTMATLLIFFWGCSNEQSEPPATQAPKIVKILDLQESGSYKRSAEFPAQISALRDTTMAFEVSGKIIAFNFQEGEWVQKGDVIAKLDDTIFQANYDSALAKYTKAKTDYVRYEGLYQAKSISKTDFEKAKQNFELAQAQYRIAQKNLENTKLTAEYNGVIAKKLVNDFARITAKQPILKLQDNSAFKVAFFAPEKEVLRLKSTLTPQKLSAHIDFRVVLNDLPEEVFEATLLHISTAAEKITRTFEVTLLIRPKPDLNLLPGMSAHVKAEAKEAQPGSVLIPYSAIFSDETKGAFVWTVGEEQRVVKQKVLLGSLTGDKVEVLEGLARDVKIVVSGVDFLNQNDQVQAYKKLGN